MGAKISQSGYTLLRTDGTVEGTTPVTTLTDAPKNFFKFNEKAVFTVNQRLWITDGTAANTKPVVAGGPLLSESPGFVQVGSVLYFVAKHELDQTWDLSCGVRMALCAALVWFVTLRLVC